MVLKVIETFSGIGAQAKALERIKARIPDYKYDIVATVEWEIGAIYAYDIIHNGQQDLSIYDDLTKDDLVDRLSLYNLSSDGKNPISDNLDGRKYTLKRMNLEKLKGIYHSIVNNNNLVDISSVHADDLPEADMLTYSFPCQDLSISSYWHQNFSGIDRDAHNRSGLLWQIERILKEYNNQKLKKPRFLLMENVTAIKSPRNVDNFNMWQEELEKLGYKSYTDLDLNAKNFGIPQNRVRTYMLSVLIEDQPESWTKIQEFLDNRQNKLHQVKDDPDISEFLRLDYNSRPEYLQEALDSTPNWTPSRETIYNDSVKLARGKEVLGPIAKTITTKQDRNPNAGIIIHKLNLDGNKAPYRNLTPRETFLLMGFDEDDFDNLIQNNMNVTKSRSMLSHSKLLKLSGNSIVVNVLEEIFTQTYRIDNLFFKNVRHLDVQQRNII